MASLAWSARGFATIGAAKPKNFPPRYTLRSGNSKAGVSRLFFQRNPRVPCCGSVASLLGASVVVEVKQLMNVNEWCSFRSIEFGW